MTYEKIVILLNLYDCRCKFRKPMTSLFAWNILDLIGRLFLKKISLSKTLNYKYFFDYDRTNYSLRGRTDRPWYLVWWGMVHALSWQLQMGEGTCDVVGRKRVRFYYRPATSWEAIARRKTKNRCVQGKTLKDLSNGFAWKK